MKKMRMFIAAAGVLGLMVFGAGSALAADMPQAAPGAAVGAATADTQVNYAQAIGGYVEILEVGEDYVLVKPEEGVYDQVQLNIGEDTLLLNNKDAKRLRLADFAKGNRVYAYYSQAMTRSIPPQSYAYALLEVEENEIPAQLWVAEYVEGDMSGDFVATVQNGGLLLRLPADSWELPNQVKTEAPKLEAGDSFLAWYGAVALSYPGQATSNRTLLVSQRAAEEVKTEQPAKLQNTLLPVKATATIKEIVNTADEQYILVDLPEKGEYRLNFAAAGENATLLVDGQTGQQADWTAVKAGDKVMVSFGPQATFSLPPQSWLHYMLVNVDENPPAGLFQVEELENTSTNVIRILTDGGGLWITVNVGEAWPDDDDLPNSLVKGGYFLAWYDVVAESYPGQTTATKVREYVTSQEQADKLANRDFAAQFSAEGLTRLVCGKLDISDYEAGLHYLHGITMAPLRAVADELGWTVEWDAASNSAVITNGDAQAKVKVGDDNVIVNGQTYNWGARVNWHDYGICVPTPLFAALGANVTHDGVTMTISK